VLKQADVVLAMFLLNNEFTMERKRCNFDYYDPLTPGDSSLSPPVHSIIAAEIGDRPGDPRGKGPHNITRRPDGPLSLAV